MDVILITLGVLGFGAIVIAAYVFTVSARNHVSSEDGHPRQTGNSAHQAHAPVPRRSTDRRSGKTVQFPLTANGMVIQEDRRHLPDRRKAA